MNSQILIGVALAGGFSLIIAIYIKFMAGDLKGGIQEALKIKKAVLQNDIKHISNDQTIIKKDIEEKDKLSKESQQKIKEIQKKSIH